ncbi:hypothetical protein AHAS_Ahas19G0383200 [Arachis hypogaea]
MKRLRLSLRDSCSDNGEEKGGGGTSGQGHSSEVEPHDQESAARSRERKQVLTSFSIFLIKFLLLYILI